MELFYWKLIKSNQIHTKATATEFPGHPKTGSAMVSGNKEVGRGIKTILISCSFWIMKSFFPFLWLSLSKWKKYVLIVKRISLQIVIILYWLVSSEFWYDCNPIVLYARCLNAAQLATTFQCTPSENIDPIHIPTFIPGHFLFLWNHSHFCEMLQKYENFFKF